MFTFTVVCVLVLSISAGVSGQDDFGVTVNTCTINEVNFSVFNGTAGGVTFIEGITEVENPDCLVDLDGSLNQTLTMHYDNCGVEPNIVADGSSLSFVIIIQDKITVHILQDPRVLVTCHFASTQTTIDVTIITQSDSVDGFTPVIFTSSPQPVMTLYNAGFNQPVNSSEAVEFGQRLRLEIFLSFEIPNYDLIVKQCSVAAKRIDGNDIGNPVILIQDGCSIVEYFSNFTYLSKQARDSIGVAYEVPYAETYFEAFTPFLPGFKFTEEDILIILTCTVHVCVKGTADCQKPICEGAKRRKRQVDLPDDHTNSSLYDLHQMYRLRFGKAEELVYENTTSDGPTMVNIGTNDMCMDRLAFWGALLTLLALLVAAWLALCCFFIFVRRRRRRECRTIYIDDKASTKESTITPVEVNIVEKPLKTVPFVLPRYHPADFAVETVETVETREVA